MQIDLFFPMLHARGGHMDSICMRLAALLQNALVCFAAARMPICMLLASMRAKPIVN